MTKIRLMGRTGLERPGEFCDRAAGALDRFRDRWRPKYASGTTTLPDDALRLMCQRLLLPAPDGIDERDQEIVERSVAARAEAHRRENPLPNYEDADTALARYCYLACRAIKPRVVVETGVASGVTSAFILRALARNGRGVLDSVDLPPLAAEASRYVGALVPDELRSRWRLHVGSSRRLLPPLLQQLGHVDVFIHDSLHTYRNMRNEFRLVWPYLVAGGLLIADDVELNGAFCDWAKMTGSSHQWVVREERKQACFGIMIKKFSGLGNADGFPRLTMS